MCRNIELGWKSVIHTDHRPLLFILYQLKPVPMLTSNRLKKWHLVLTAYSYEIRHIPGNESNLADFLARKSMKGDPSKFKRVEEQLM